MPVAYLDVPTGADVTTKRDMLKQLYDALHEVWPFPDDTRIFVREWARDSVSQNGGLGSEPIRPVFVMHIPQGGDADAKRTMVKRVDAVVSAAYGMPELAIFMHEHSLSTVGIHGGVLADDQQRVDHQSRVYG